MTEFKWLHLPVWKQDRMKHIGSKYSSTNGDKWRYSVINNASLIIALSTLPFHESFSVYFKSIMRKKAMAD